LYTGLKKVKISLGPKVKDDRFFVTSQKEFVSLKTLHSRLLTITAFTCINLDWLASVHIQHVNSCIAAVYHATAPYAKKRVTEGLQNRWKRQILTTKRQILMLNPCLTPFQNLCFAATIQFTRNFFTTSDF